MLNSRAQSNIAFNEQENGDSTLENSTVLVTPSSVSNARFHSYTSCSEEENYNIDTQLENESNQNTSLITTQSNTCASQNINSNTLDNQQTFPPASTLPSISQTSSKLPSVISFSTDANSNENPRNNNSDADDNKNNNDNNDDSIIESIRHKTDTNYTRRPNKMDSNHNAGADHKDNKTKEESTCNTHDTMSHRSNKTPMAFTNSKHTNTQLKNYSDESNSDDGISQTAYHSNNIKTTSKIADNKCKKRYGSSKSLYPTPHETYNPISSTQNTGRRSAPIFSRRSFRPSVFWTSRENVSVQNSTEQKSPLLPAKSAHKNVKSPTKVAHKNVITATKNYPGVSSSTQNKSQNDYADDSVKRSNRAHWGKNDATIPPNSSNYVDELSDDLEEENILDIESHYGHFSQGEPRLSSPRSNAPILRYFTPDLNSGRTVCLFLDNNNHRSRSAMDHCSNKDYNSLNRNQNNQSPALFKQLDHLYIEANLRKNGQNSRKSDDEKTPLLNSRSSPVVPLTKTNPSPNKTAVYKKRWYLLFVFCVYNLIWNAVWTTWGPIAQSAKAVFDWSDGNIAMFTWLSTVPVIVVMFPFAYLMDVKGMRISMIVCTGITMLGTGLRCISRDPTAATWLNYAGQLLNGAAGAVPMSAGAVISALWFPANQRATATGIATIMGYLGACVSFIIGPLVVPEPKESEHPINTSANYQELNQLFGNASGVNITDISELRDNIMNILYYQCGGAVLIFLLVLIYFPSKPSLPPSKSAALPREDYVDGLKMLVRNKQFWFTAIAYGVPIGVYEVWQVILDVILNPRVSQETAGWLDFYGTLGGCIAGLLMSRFADLFTRQIKLFLIVFYLLASGSILWFILLVNDVLPFDTISLYSSIIITGVCLDGSAPLFFELVIEVSYPSGEGVTSGLLQMIVATAGTVFLSLTQLEMLGKAWMNWCFLGCSVLSIPLLALIKTEFARAEMDEETDESISSDEDTIMS